MTRLAVMQPYFFPYLGYWQLLRAVDRFVVYDDVSYIKGGWINRNRVLVGGAPAYVCVPLQRASSFSRICDLSLGARSSWRDKLVRTVQCNYARSPCFTEMFPWVEALIRHETSNLAAYLLHQLQSVAACLGLQAEFVASSRVYGNEHLSGQERVLDICRRESADTYVNLPGGSHLYDAADFGRAGVALRFIVRHAAPYAQRAPGFVPGLSVIDALMELGPAGTRRLVDAVDLSPRLADRTG